MRKISLLCGLSAVLMSGGAQAATELSMWYHGAGNPEESQVIERIIADFNASQDDWRVVLESLPENAYNDSVTAAALAGNLPDILDVDGPIMPNWAWAGYLQPLNIDPAIVEDYLPGALGYWDGELYSVGLWDAAVGIFARKSVLDTFDIRVPTLAEPWTGEEFDAILAKLEASGEFEYAFDPGMAWTGEWYAYAFSPMLNSFGGGLIDRDTYLTAEGVLNGPEAVAFGQWWQTLFEKGYAPGTSQDPAARDNGLLSGKYALQLNGIWAAPAALEALGEDWLFLPAVDFGHGPKIGAASWQFGVSSTTEHAEGANAFLEFALTDENMAAFTKVLGLVPPTASAAAMTELYAEGGALEEVFALSEGQAVLRPVTPGYLVQSRVFAKAINDITNGADVIDALDAAVDDIEADIANNNGYGH